MAERINNTISQFLEKDHYYLEQLRSDFFSAINNFDITIGRMERND